MTAAEIHVTPRVEEVVIAAVVGAALGFALVAPFVTGLPGYLPGRVHGVIDIARALLAWVVPLAGAITGGAHAACQPRDTHRQGVRYYPDPGEACRALTRQERAHYSPAQRAGRVTGIVMGGVPFARRSETGHLYLVGLTGGGKTATLEGLIDQLLARGDRAIVHDLKGDLVARYFQPATGVLLGPWDARAALWDAAADIDSPARADEFAAAVCGVRVAAGADAHWVRSAANVLRGLIKSYMRDGRPWTWADLCDVLTGDPVRLVQRAATGEPLVRTQFASAFVGTRGGPPSGHDGPGLSREGSSILSTLAAKVGWLLAYAAVDAADRDRERFSLQQWLTGQAHREKRLVFLNHNALYAGVCEPLFGALVATVRATVTSPLMPEVAADAPAATWCIFDEFPQLGAAASAATEALAALGRSRGIRVVLALQDETQLAAKLGTQQAASLLAQQVSRIYLRCSPQTADAVCRRTGNHQVDRIETNASNGAVQGKTKRAVEVPVMRPDALTGLQVRPAGVEMIVHIGATLGRLWQPYPERRAALAEPYVESATWRRGTLPVKSMAASTAATGPASNVDLGAAPVKVAGGGPKRGRADALPDLDGARSAVDQGRRR